MHLKDKTVLNLENKPAPEDLTSRAGYSCYKPLYGLTLKVDFLQGP